MATINLTADSFEEVLAGNEIVLIDFWASWCGPCRMFGPIFEQASDRHADVAFTKVDTEQEQALASQFGIRAIPTLAAFRQGLLVFMQPGVMPEEGLDELISKLKALDMDEVRKDIEAQKADESAD